MQKIVSLFVAATLGAAPAYSQTQRPDHLMPENSILSGGDSMFSAKYYGLVTDVLAEGYARNVTLRAVVLPSFSPEYLLGLRETSSEGSTGYRVFYLRPTIHLWGYESPYEPKSRLPANPKDVPLVRCERPLDTAVAQQVSTAWTGILRETRYLPAEPSVGLDGIMYHFSADLRWEGLLAGNVWSPDPGSKPGRLAELAETLARYCDGKAEATELERQATELTERLNK